MILMVSCVKEQTTGALVIDEIKEKLCTTLIDDNWTSSTTYYKNCIEQVEYTYFDNVTGIEEKRIFERQSECFDYVTTENLSLKRVIYEKCT